MNSFIGWDLGGWNCDRNVSSQDALVILDDERKILGRPWRGNLRLTINESENSLDWAARLFRLCDAEVPDLTQIKVVIAIDIPLGFSSELVELLTQFKAAPHPQGSAENPYLYRATERFLFSRGLKPLSPVKDMIGSQATKGMHALARFAPDNPHCGLWVKEPWLQAIEAYPAACKHSRQMRQMLEPYIDRIETDQKTGKEIRRYGQGLKTDDHRDALICALVAWLFRHHPEALAHPGVDIPIKEGWIYVPLDGLFSKG